MYNRYIPQPDGSYRRNRMQEPQRPSSPPIQQPAPPGVFSNANPEQEPPDASSSRRTSRTSPGKRNVTTSADSFLRRLLPGNLDTEDLLVIILLLLMAGDGEEDRNTALLTLALYLFL